MNAENGKIVIVKDTETGLLGAVVCPSKEFCSVVFEDGTWVHFVESEISPLSKTLKTDRTMSELDIVGEAVFAPIRIEPFGEIPADAQEKYVEAALASVNLFREAGRWE
ncbi:hypothetical protein [Leptospirillum sp. Group II 'CF-1']|jgi:hypothetical protein|uniref:hypothetical protein n=1 Tax=Leptospirillum sp. Group II 'CF-1' TaxID=1660083 RepID=UPI000A6A7787|nr:hypothetical protein [Leptospirillum sp. Group II 'CF-1']